MFYIWSLKSGVQAFLHFSADFFQLEPRQNYKVEIKHKRRDNPAEDGSYVETDGGGSHVLTDGPMVLCGNENIGLWNQVGMGKNWSGLGVREIDPDVFVILGRA